MTFVDTESIRQAATQAGADTVGFTSARPFPEALETLLRRKERGLAGPLHFTYERPEVAADVRRSLRWARSVAVIGCTYVRSASPPADTGPIIGRFATRDHYDRVRSAAAAVIAVIEEAGGKAELLVDDIRFLDRAAAVRAGLGWIGRSTMVLSPGHGPWQLFGSVVTDLDLRPTAPMLRSCGTCTVCVPACPTGAITSDGLDARLCISTWLQTPGFIPLWVRPLIERRIYGCDDCLTACPPGFPALGRVDAPTETLSFAELLGSSDDDLMKRFHWFYIPHRDARYLRRNLLVAAGNSEEADAIGPILDHFTHRSAIVRGHAYWALARSLGSYAWMPLRRRHAFESVPEALEELETSMAMLREPNVR